ncbi:hypothetical protein O3P69_019015 [Scylla paramamosain]|uniref:Integrase zinc-binding domain-containing protein n=1 Tax=Scylla paramamosain TaxID=85552 RepID=A0AAW0T7Y1_SCYPA
MHTDHLGIKRTQYFAWREISREVTRAEAREAVNQCDMCHITDLAPMKWRHGSLGVEETWWRLAIDITHHLGLDYLSIVDRMQSWFCVWRELRRSKDDTIVKELELVFCEWGAPSPAQKQTADDTTPGGGGGEEYSTGDTVWITKRGERCTSMSQPAVITRVTSLQVAEVDCMPRHVRDMRDRDFITQDDSIQPGTHDAVDDPPLYIGVQMHQEQHQQQQHTLYPQSLRPRQALAGDPEATDQRTTLRCSTLVRRSPNRLCSDIADQGGV